MSSSSPTCSAPALGTIEAWCFELLTSASLAHKLAPPPIALGLGGAFEVAPPARRLEGPSRPGGLEVARKSHKSPTRGSLVRPEARARLLHTCMHHELQAAELFAWALLAFPETPREFRIGLLRLCGEELAHLALYRERLADLGFEFGAFPVRDWFWERARDCQTPLQFVALMGLGLEAGNLEHGARFADWFRSVGDLASAQVFEQVEREEIGHVAFGRIWFERLSGAALDFAAWQRALPAPISPALLRGQTLNRAARGRAGLSPSFLDELEAFPPIDASRPRFPVTTSSPSTPSIAAASPAPVDPAGALFGQGAAGAPLAALAAPANDRSAWPASTPVGSLVPAAASVRPVFPCASASPVAWVLNLDAEHELEQRGPFTPSVHLRTLVAREQHRILPGLIQPGDVVLDPSAPDFEARLVRARGLPGRCWAPTPNALALLAGAGALPPVAPSVEVLRRVNARPFAVAVRAPLLDQTGSASAASFHKHIAASLEAALAQLACPAPLGWLVRRTFGAAGRGRRRIAAGKPDPAELSWLQASLRLGPLSLEPFVEIEREYTRSAYLRPDGGFELLAPCFQTTTAQGAWLHTRPADRFEDCPQADDQALASALEAVAQALHRAGYFGPFGIDGYRHKRTDQPGSALNPLSEINARFTMDFAVAGRSVVPAG